MYFTDIINSLLVKNRLIFAQSANQSFALDTLKMVYVELSYETLSSSLLNERLFANMNTLIIVGILNSIHDNLFQRFAKLKVLMLKINNLNDFFHNDHKWLASLNSNVQVRLNNKKDVHAQILQRKYFIFNILSSKVFESFLNVYEYPDEDLCLFKQFPHEHLVFPFIYPEVELACTCTLKWIHLHASELIQEVKYTDLIDSYQVSSEENLTNVYRYCQKRFAEMSCDFELKFEACNLTRVRRVKKVSINNDVDLYFAIKWLEYILVLIAQPILSVASIVVNILVIAVLQNRQNHAELNDRMYSYAQINALFNVLYSAIMLVKLVNTCVFFYSAGQFCSAVYQTKSSQYFKIVGVYYLGNVFKNCSNVSYLFFSMSRYISVTLEKKRKLIVLFNGVSVKRFCLLVLVLSSSLSVFVLFQYELNVLIDYRKEFPYEKRNEHFCLDKANRATCDLFNAFKIANQMLNGVVFLLLNVAIDIMLVHDFGIEMSTKSRLELNKPKRQEFKLKTKKISKMVLLNGVAYVASHTPVLVTTLILVVFSRRMVNFCSARMSCDLINEEAEVFKHISMISIFFILKHFNRHFNDSFQELKHKLLFFTGHKLDPFD